MPSDSCASSYVVTLAFVNDKTISGDNIEHVHELKEDKAKQALWRSRLIISTFFFL